MTLRWPSVVAQCSGCMPTESVLGTKSGAPLSDRYCHRQQPDTDHSRASIRPDDHRCLIRYNWVPLLSCVCVSGWLLTCTMSRSPLLAAQCTSEWPSASSQHQKGTNSTRVKHMRSSA